jgi:hypothetical protein
MNIDLGRNIALSEIQKQANIILVEAYKKGGRVYYKDVKNGISADMQDINRILKSKGKMMELLEDGSWDHFDLDLSGFKSGREKIPGIFKKKKRGALRHILVGIFISVAAYFVIQLILWIAEWIGQ